MADNAENPLEKILQKLEALESEVKSLGARMDAVDHLRAEPVVEPEPPAKEPEAPPARPMEDLEQILPKVKTTPEPKPVPPPIPAKATPRALAPGPYTKKTYSAPPVDNLASSSVDAVYQNENRPAENKQSVATEEPKDSWEMRIASRWLPRVGILFLALVLILLAREHVQGPMGKVIGSYLLAAGLIGVGVFYDKKYPQWARPVLAGGLAFSYFASYAMGFVEPMRLLDNLHVKLGVLAVNIAVIFGFAQWKKSEATAGTALVLGYLTTGVVGNDVAALCSSLALSVVALLFLWRNQWFGATALAAAATYIAYFYIWKAVPAAVERSASEAFWYHFMFLSLNFVVYTAAGFVGKSAALAEPVETSALPGRRAMLALLTQTNVAAYIAAMVLVLKTTGVYWDQAWLFFLSLALVFAVLVFLFRGLASIQQVNAMAGTVCFTFGLMALASPGWLPVFLTLQAVIMLAGGARRNPGLWGGLSFLVLVYGCAYLVTGGRIDWLDFGTSETINYPWWTHGCVAAVALVYACAWERLVHIESEVSRPQTPQREPYAGQNKRHTAYAYGDLASLMPALAAGIAAIIWRYTLQYFGTPNGQLVLGMAVPVVAIAAVVSRFKAPLTFIALTMIFGLVSWDLLRDSMGWHGGSYRSMFLLGLAGMGAGWIVEREPMGSAGTSRFLWRILYVWSQLLMIIGIWRWAYDWHVLAALAVLFAASVAAGWLLRSAAMAKSAWLSVAAFLLWSLLNNMEAVPAWVIIAGALVVMCAAYPMALPLWNKRTGDRMTPLSYWGQAAVAIAAGLVWSPGLADHGWNPVLAGGSWTLLCALFAATGMFGSVAWTAVVFAAFSALALIGRWVDDTVMATPEAFGAADAAWGLAGVFMIVAAERVLNGARRLAMPWANDNAWWLSRQFVGSITIGLAVGTLAMAVVVLRMMPDLRVFYFTGAMVAAAFVWIVLGIWFHEPIYRKSGFVLLCAGIVKGLIWDVMSLKKIIYRQVSWTVLGLLALAASFLYNRFRGRME